MVTKQFEIILDPKDKHWVRLEDPGKCAKEEKYWWVSNCVGKKPRPHIIIKIPEILGKVNPKIKIRWDSSGWCFIGLDKSKDGVNWKNIWSRTGMYLGGTYEIPLDPEYAYYRIWFSDGDYSCEITKVYKKCVVSYEVPKEVSLKVPQTLMIAVGGAVVIASVALLLEISGRRSE